MSSVYKVPKVKQISQRFFKVLIIKNINCFAKIKHAFYTGLINKKAFFVINESQKAIFSLDIPLCMQGDSDKMMRAAVKANYTITFGLHKKGNFLYPGFELCGNLYVTHISFPAALQNRADQMVAVNNSKPFPDRKENILNDTINILQDGCQK